MLCQTGQRLGSGTDFTMYSIEPSVAEENLRQSRGMTNGSDGLDYDVRAQKSNPRWLRDLAADLYGRRVL